MLQPTRPRELDRPSGCVRLPRAPRARQRAGRLAALLAAVLLAAAGAAEERFFDWTRLAFSPQEHAERRAALAAELRGSGGGVLLVPSAPGRSDGSTFRQLDDFHYLTGLELPDSVLALDSASGTALLFAPTRDARFESAERPNDFPGRPLQADPDLSRVSGIAEILPFEAFASHVALWARGGKLLRVDPGGPGAIGETRLAPVERWSGERHLLEWLRQEQPAATLRSAWEDVARVRSVKSPEELVRLRHAAELTTAAIRSAAWRITPGIDERSLEAEFEAACKRGGAQRLAFDSIVKSGPNALWPWRVLASHYDRRNRALQPGELVILDVGCELDHYASDVGRTFPVSGRFDPVQRALLEMEVAVADRIRAAVRPGVTLEQLRRAAESAIPAAERAHMQTGSFYGHHVGLSAGDPALPDAPLRPGAVITVEPWFYDHERGVAVFTEDMVAVTADGAESLTEALPRSPAELEALVGGGR